MKLEEAEASVLLQQAHQRYNYSHIYPTTILEPHHHHDASPAPPPPGHGFGLPYSVAASMTFQEAEAYNYKLRQCYYQHLPNNNIDLTTDIDAPDASTSPDDRQLLLQQLQMQMSASPFLSFPPPLPPTPPLPTLTQHLACDVLDRTGCPTNYDYNYTSSTSVNNNYHVDQPTTNATTSSTYSRSNPSRSSSIVDSFEFTDLDSLFQMLDDNLIDSLPPLLHPPPPHPTPDTSVQPSIITTNSASSTTVDDYNYNYHDVDGKCSAVNFQSYGSASVNNYYRSRCKAVTAALATTAAAAAVAAFSSSSPAAPPSPTRTSLPASAAPPSARLPANTAAAATSQGPPTPPKRSQTTADARKKPKRFDLSEPKYIVVARNFESVLKDGFKWRKYGQKSVKHNMFPRSYYKCSYEGCYVHKHVERLASNPCLILTTYRGRHNH